MDLSNFPLVKSIESLSIKYNIALSSKDIESARNISQSLEGIDNEESFSNIVDFIDKNIRFWDERFYAFIVIYFAFVCMIILTILLLGPLVSLFDIFMLLIPFILCILLVKHKTFNLIINYVILLSTLSITILIKTMNLIPNLVPSYSMLCIIWGILVGIIIGNFFTIYLAYTRFPSEEKGFNRILILADLIKSTFELGFDVEKILKYRVAVCRDYARLTSAILTNLNIKHYFVTIPLHIAVAVELNGEYFIIDQRSPLKQIDKWLDSWKCDHTAIYEVSIEDQIKYSKVKGGYTINRDNLQYDITEKQIAEIQNHLLQRLKTAQKGYNKLIEKISVKDAAYYYDLRIHKSVLNYIFKEINNRPVFFRNIDHINVLKEERNLIIQLYE